MLSYDHLLGLDFDIEKRNCYSLVRDFYHDNYGIELTPYACPHDWWDRGMNLMAQLAPAEGFSPLHCPAHEYRAGDVIVMSIGARLDPKTNTSTGNHCAVLLDTGKILHHLVGQRSTVTSYGGLFRNTTIGVYRHRDVPLLKSSEDLLDIRDYLPPHVRRRLAELEEARKLAGAETGGEGDA